MKTETFAETISVTTRPTSGPTLAITTSATTTKPTSGPTLAITTSATTTKPTSGPTLAITTSATTTKPTSGPTLAITTKPASSSKKPNIYNTINLIVISPNDKSISKISPKPSIKIFLELLNVVGEKNVFTSSKDSYTCFIPSDEAFQKILQPSFVARLSSFLTPSPNTPTPSSSSTSSPTINPSTDQKVIILSLLQYHILNQNIKFSNLKNKKHYKSLSKIPTGLPYSKLINFPILIKLIDNKTNITVPGTLINAKSIQTDIACSNGKINIIDSILIPPYLTTLVDTLK